MRRRPPAIVRVLASMAVLLICGAAFAQAYPERVVHVVFLWPAKPPADGYIIMLAILESHA